jgi:nucleoside transporter
MFVPQALVAENGAMLIALLFGYTLCYMPTLALTNNIAFHSLSNIDKTFPVVRVFGTIGWIVAGIFIGVTGISSSVTIFQVAAICSVALALYSLTLPHTPAPAKGLPVAMRDLFCADAFALLKTRHFFVFSLCAMLISVPLGTYYAYTASYLADAGVADVSTAMSFGQMSEIFFMLVIPLLFRRLGVKYMLLIGMCAWFVRYAFFALGVSEEGRFLLYLGILLHGVCYDFSSSSALSTPTAWRAKGKRSGAKHDCDVHLWHWHAAGLANFRRAVQPPCRRADVAAGVGDLLVDPGDCRGRYRADFPSFF